MSQSKIGDTYNIRAAAFLATQSKQTHIPGMEFRNAFYNIIPEKIKLSWFEKDLSFDIIIRSETFDFYAECKYASDKKRFTYKSSEFKEAILEFYGAEKYRVMAPNANQIYYLFISNSDRDSIYSDLVKLKTSGIEELRKYINNLKIVGKRKWNIDVTKYIKDDIFRTCLDRIRLISIHDYELVSIYDDEKYKNKYDMLLTQIPTEKIYLYDIYKKYSDIIQIGLYGDVEYKSQIFRNYNLKVSSNFLTEIEFNKPQYIKKITKNNIAKTFSNRVDFSNSTIYDREHTILKIITFINDTINNDCYYIIIDTNLMNIFYVNREWMEKILDYKDRDGFYLINKIRSEAPLELSDYSIYLLLNEASRLSSGISISKKLVIS